MLIHHLCKISILTITREINIGIKYKNMIALVDSSIYTM